MYREMGTIIAIFLCALFISLLLTPQIRKLAMIFNLVDRPSGRKVHDKPIPHIGGVAIYFSLFLSFIPFFIYKNALIGQLLNDMEVRAMALGAIIVFGLGLIDDIRMVRARTKLSFHIVAGIIAFIGDIKVTAIGLPGLPLWHLGGLSLPITIFWFVLVINAINLIDGLDGLAAGVCFFACIILLTLCIIRERYVVAVVLAALSGSIMGFLRYNYNPASIFMGDCGSYFLGYMLAALSIMGSFKSQTAVSILIPMIALGVPLMDTTWSTIRRFMLGKKIFKADKDHFHHRLLKLGYSHNRVVFTLYGFTILLGTIAVFMVWLQDGRSALILIIAAACTIFGIRKMGYLDFVAMSQIKRWGEDITDELGIKRDRRIFLSSQLNILTSNYIEQFWEKVVLSARMIEVDYLEMKLYSTDENSDEAKKYYWHLTENTKDKDHLYSDKRLYLRFPLEHKGIRFGTIIMSKEMQDSALFKTRTLARIESLRRTMSTTLYKLNVK